MRKHFSECSSKRSRYSQPSSIEPERSITTVTIDDNSTGSSMSVASPPVPTPSPFLHRQGTQLQNHVSDTDSEVMTTAASGLIRSPLSSRGNSRQFPMATFVDILSPASQQEFELKLAKFIFSCNLPFNIVENEEFKEFILSLRPAFKIPSHEVIGDRILKAVYNETRSMVAKEIGGKNVTLQQDGWGTSSVTDNCSTMQAMRTKIQEQNPSFMVYGCHSHLLNLVGQEFTPKDLKDSVVKVQSYFRNNHFASASLANKQGRRPVIPGDTRWNSQLDCFDSYVVNQTKYLEVSREMKIINVNKKKKEVAAMPDDIQAIVQDNEIFDSVKLTLKLLKPVALALDHLQSDYATLADAVSRWLKLESDLGENSSNQMFRKYMGWGMTPVAVAANMLHPKYRGKDLPKEYVNMGHKWLSDPNNNGSGMFIIAAENLKLGDTEFFPETMMDSIITSKMDPANWWAAVNSIVRLPVGLLQIAQKLMKLPSSTAGLERSFSTLNNIMTKLRNRLGVEKAAMLCFIYQYYRVSKLFDVFLHDKDLE